MASVLSARTGGALGAIGIATWVALYAVAVTSYAGYDITENFLSDLGHPDAPAAWAFNAGAILGGLLLLPFGFVVGRTTGGHLGLAGGVLLAAAAAFLLLVGVFPEESPYNLHFVVSAGFFLLLALAAATLAVPMHVSPAFGPVAGWLAGATVAASAALVLTGVAPLFEHITVYIGLGWSAFGAGRLLRAGP